RPFDTVTMPYGEQTLWPDHCVQGTSGAAFHCDLAIPHAQLIVRKGYHPAIDSYSAFRENDKSVATGLAGYLRERGLRRGFIAGLALDFCVRFSAVGAVSAGFAVVVIEDATKPVDLPGTKHAAYRDFAAVGAVITESGALRLAA